MKQLMTALALTLSLAFAHAADKPASAPSAKQAAQQEKMTACNKSAGDKKGDDRQAYMKTCLSKKS
jgi:hypothetical protein